MAKKAIAPTSETVEESQQLKDYKAAQLALSQAGKALVDPLVKQLDGVTKNAKSLQKDGIDLKDLKYAVAKLNKVLNPAPKAELVWDDLTVLKWMKENAKNKTNKKSRADIESGVLGSDSGKKFKAKSWADFTKAKCLSEGEAASKEYWLK